MSIVNNIELGIDPNGWRINCCSFQQDAILTFGRYQYVSLYVPSYKDDPSSSRMTTIGRRKLPDGQWKFLTFRDYYQIKNDGHNIISMGISGDGIIHMAWDMHGDGIHYRQSRERLALSETEEDWCISSFGKVLDSLQGHGKEYVFHEITYPRFLTLPCGDILLEFRVGRSGLGDEYLYRFSSKTHTWYEVVTPLIQGVGNNAYIHGLDYGTDKKLHMSWTYRDFIEDRVGVNDRETSQAGPNGPENNHDLHYVYSPDEGCTWYNGKHEKLNLPINVSSPTLAIKIPKHSGIMNQEGQCVDGNGGFHVLGRENGYYFHYYLNPINGQWLRRKINNYIGKLFGARGKIVCHNSNPNAIHALIPLYGEKFVILRSQVQDEKNLIYSGSNIDWKILQTFEGLDGEPLYDRYRKDNIISILQRVGILGLNHSANPFYEKNGIRKIVLIDLNLSTI